jgi:hypothetical protein
MVAVVAGDTIAAEREVAKTIPTTATPATLATTVKARSEHTVHFGLQLVAT